VLASCLAMPERLQLYNNLCHISSAPEAFAGHLDISMRRRLPPLIHACPVSPGAQSLSQTSRVEDSRDQGTHLYNVCPNNVSHRSHRSHHSHRRHTLWIPSKRGLMTTHNLQAGHLSLAYRHPQEASKRPVQASCRPRLPFAPGYPPSIQRRGEASAL
jgi:hypothetical protein